MSRGIAGQCLCERAELLVSVRDRIAEQIHPDAFTLKGYELAGLAKNAIDLDRLCADYEARASNTPDATNYAALSPDELDVLNALLTKASEAEPVKGERPRRCEHVELIARIRDRAEEYLTSSSVPLEGYEISRLTTATVALEKILAEADEREGESTLDLSVLSEGERATVERLTAKTRG